MCTFTTVLKSLVPEDEGPVHLGSPIIGGKVHIKLEFCSLLTYENFILSTNREIGVFVDN